MNKKQLRALKCASAEYRGRGQYNKNKNAIRRHSKGYEHGI